MTVRVEHGLNRTERPPLLHGQTDPRSLFAQIRRMQERIDALERFAGGFVRPDTEKTLQIGSADVPAFVVTSGGGAGVGAASDDGAADPAFTGPNQIPVSDGTGAAAYKTIGPNEVVLRAGAGIAGSAMGTNTVLHRAGGNVGALSLAASRIPGRKATGDIAALTGDEVAEIAAAFQTPKSTLTVAEVTGASPTLNLDQDTHAGIIVRAWTGTATINLPTGSGVRVGKVFWIFDLLRAATAGAPIVLAPGTGNTISSLSAGTSLTWDGGANYCGSAFVMLGRKSGSTLNWALMLAPNTTFY